MPAQVLLEGSILAQEGGSTTPIDEVFQGLLALTTMEVGPHFDLRVSRTEGYQSQRLGLIKAWTMAQGDAPISTEQAAAQVMNMGPGLYRIETTDDFLPERVIASQMVRIKPRPDDPWYKRHAGKIFAVAAVGAAAVGVGVLATKKKRSA
jgi:hypothetical protein